MLYNCSFFKLLSKKAVNFQHYIDSVTDEWMTPDNWWNDTRGWKNIATKKICPGVTFLFTTNPTWIFLALKPDLPCDRPAANAWAKGRQRHFHTLFLNTSLKLPIKSETVGNERDVDHFMYWRKYDIKKNAEYLPDDKEIRHRNTKCAFISSHKNSGQI